MEFHFYGRALTEINASLSTYVLDSAANVIASIAPTAYTLLMIYVMLWGWSTLRGMISEPVTDGVTRVVRLSVITALAINLGHYNTYVVDFLWNFPDALATALVSGSSPASNMSYLDELWSKAYNLGDAYWQRAHAPGAMLPSFGEMLTAIAVWVGGLLATGFAAFLLVMSKVTLAVLLAVGPIFVLMTMFEGTRRFFDAWIGQALNSVLLVMLTAGAIKLMLAVVEKYFNAVAAMGALANPGISQAVPAIELCLIAFLIFLQLPSTASALAGGVAISTLGAPSFAFKKAGDTLSAMRPSNMRRSLNRLRSDVRITAGAAKATAAAPMAVYRKITGQSRTRTKRS